MTIKALRMHALPSARTLGRLLLMLVLVSRACLWSEPVRAPKTVPALLLSDIHFDPFADPAKISRLAAAPASEWDQIFAAPSSPNREKDYTALLETCNLRGPDTSAELWTSSLQAIKAKAADASFVTVSGDVLAHNFDCKFNQRFPGAKEAERVAFIEETIRYVVRGLRSALPNVPIYVAMGNNDSGCGDYRDERHSPFLTQTAKILAETIPPSERSEMVRDFTAQGSYAATLPASVPNTRILVLDDLFLSSKYGDCAGKPNAVAPAAQIHWLEAQLAMAREHRQHVWVLGHIPTGVDLYATLTSMRNICGRGTPKMFLGNEQLAEVLAANAETVSLAVFGHSHTDELRLLTSEKTPGRPGTGVAVKIVTSISPVNGNNPAFTVARVDPATAGLVDYTVFSASNLTGVNSTWSKEYTFSETYHQPAFNPATLKVLTDGFRLDTPGNTAESAAYLRNFYVGDRSVLIKPLWPEYVCALTHDSAQSFTNCVCKK
ncbi:metallophosphoesterase [Granulicella sibirica]|uniref:Acid sphingomyelinase-like phosphodiesterase 3b n=1 Tax=Granulicella sibirica TaxID=2479048 RepID=A0A4Q0T071_9BACT|nr:metallophosphoesterase [Granulicella sibirica]RXH56973.1 Acid sphingomyelinase-like phosphodiesterase 3b precursor [Granulicella sibirica]